MKKRWKRTSILLALLVIIYVGIQPGMLVGKPAIKAASAVLMDAGTKQIILDYNGSDQVSPAGISKIMTELLVMDAISNGEVNWDDSVAISQYASSVGGKQLSLKQGDRFTVRELFNVVSLYSANDATIALAEHISGSESAFVDAMNRKAAEIGLSEHTHFANSTGLHTESLGPHRPDTIQGDSSMTALDACNLAYYLIRHHPEILKISSQIQVSMNQKGMYVSNTNWMLPSIDGPYAYDGGDGLKTGYDQEDGYHFVGTAERSGKRLISVVFGSETQEGRFAETRKLLNYGFTSKQ